MEQKKKKEKKQKKRPSIFPVLSLPNLDHYFFFFHKVEGFLLALFIGPLLGDESVKSSWQRRGERGITRLEGKKGEDGMAAKLVIVYTLLASSFS